MTEVDFLMTTLLNRIWQGALLTLAMWIFLKLVPRLNPTTRFTVLWATLLAIVALLVAPYATKSVAPAADSPVIQGTNKPSTPPPARMERPRSGSQNPDTELPLHPLPVHKSNAESVTSLPSEASRLAIQFVRTETAPSSTAAIAMAAIQHPLVRIHSGRVLDAFEIVWAFLSLLMLTRLHFGYRKLRRLKTNARPISKEWQLRLRIFRKINGVRRQAQLLVSSRIEAPMSLGFLKPAILIPQSLFDTLSDTELEHVVLHELAHIQRRDDWTNLAQRLIEALLPIQPAVFWIGQRMSIEREMACDDWVIAVTGVAEPYATSLTRVAELSRWGRADMLAAGATGNRSQLFSRIHHMLDRTRNAAPKLNLAPLAAAIAFIGMLVYGGVRAPHMIAFAQTSETENSVRQLTGERPSRLAESRNPATPLAREASLASMAATGTTAFARSSSPQSPQEPLAPAEPKQSGKTHMEMTTRDGSTSLSIKLDGAIEFTDDDRDIKSLSPGGHFRIEEETSGSSRTYEVRADSGENLTKTYSVDSSVRPLDAEAQAWLLRLMPQVIRESGVGAGRRVARILGQGGPDAVIHEIGLIHGDGSKRIYLEQLFSQANLNTQELRVASTLIRGISSDGDKAQVLLDVDRKYFTGELRQNLFEAVESISSDGDKRRVLSDILKKDAGSDDTVLGVARAAKHISSDGDKAEVLIEMASSYRDKGELGTAYFEAVKSISSDGDHARVLLALLAANGDDRETLDRVLRSAAKISSDGDKARVLKEAVTRYNNAGTISKAFIDAANSISSDGDHQQVLVALVHRRGIDAATADEIVKSAERISSDGDKALVLVELLQVNVELVRDDFFAAANTISSDGDHSRVLIALLDKPGTSPAMAVAAIQSATRISSDGDKGRVLLDAARRYSFDPQVEAALRAAVESLHSDGEYRSVMSQLSRPNESK